MTGDDGVTDPRVLGAELFLDASMGFVVYQDPDRPVNAGYLADLARYQVDALLRAGWTPPAPQVWLPAHSDTVHMPMARPIRADSWLNEDRFREFRAAYTYAAAKTLAIPGLSKIDPEEAFYVWRIIQRGVEVYKRMRRNPSPARREVSGDSPDGADGDVHE